MTSAAEAERPSAIPMIDPPFERPVFVAADDRRARLVRYGGGAAILLACLWLVALAVGMLGIGRLPDVSLPSIVRGADHSRSDAPANVDPFSPATSARAVAPQRSSRASTRTDVGRKSAAQAPARRNAAPSARRVERTSTVPATTPPPQAVRPPVVTPAPAPAAAAPNQGWARQGYTAPRGQARQTEPKPAPSTPGQMRRAEAQAFAPGPAPAPTTTTSEPPGQQKKTEEPKPKG